MSKRFPTKFTFLIPNAERIRAEAKEAGVCPIWINSVLEEINAMVSAAEAIQKVGEGQSSSFQEVTPIIEIPCETSQWPRRNTDPNFSTAKLQELEERMQQVLKLKDIFKTKDKKKKGECDEEDSDLSDYECFKQRKKDKKKKAKILKKTKKRVKSSSESSSSSSSSSDDSDYQGEVGEKGDSGMYICPFPSLDNRGFKDVKVQVKGQKISRKFVRVALHNLYAESYTMANLATALVTEANASAFKPFSTDVAWLHLHTKYLDRILLNALEGPLTLWNEAWINEIFITFLELIVKISATKEYATCLYDKVHKWMCKRRVGVNPKYGPVPYFIQQAKLTETGLLLFQGNRSQRKDVKASKPNTTGPAPKGGSPVIAAGPKQG